MAICGGSAIDGSIFAGGTCGTLKAGISDGLIGVEPWLAGRTHAIRCA